jgi:hypothetical protein
MNEDTKKLREIVERATASGDRISGDLDAETAALRQGWLEFGKLLQREMQAGGSLADDTASELERAGAELAEFGRILATAPNTPAPSATSTKSSRRSVWPKVVAVVAASLLVAAGAFFWFRALPASHPQSTNDVVTVPTDKQPNSPVPVQPDVDPHQAPDFRIVENVSLDKGVTVVSRATMAVVVPLSLF